MKITPEFLRTLVGKRILFRFRDGRYPFAKGDPKTEFRGTLQVFDPITNGNFVMINTQWLSVTDFDKIIEDKKQDLSDTLEWGDFSEASSFAQNIMKRNRHVEELMSEYSEEGFGDFIEGFGIGKVTKVDFISMDAYSGIQVTFQPLSTEEHDGMSTDEMNSLVPRLKTIEKGIGVNILIVKYTRSGIVLLLD